MIHVLQEFIGIGVGVVAPNSVVIGQVDHMNEP